MPLFDQLADHAKPVEHRELAGFEHVLERPLSIYERKDERGLRGDASRWRVFAREGEHGDRAWIEDGVCQRQRAEVVACFEAREKVANRSKWIGSQSTD